MKVSTVLFALALTVLPYGAYGMIQGFEKVRTTKEIDIPTSTIAPPSDFSAAADHRSSLYSSTTIASKQIFPEGGMFPMSIDSCSRSSTFMPSEKKPVKQELLMPVLECAELSNPAAKPTVSLKKNPEHPTTSKLSLDNLMPLPSSKSFVPKPKHVIPPLASQREKANRSVLNEPASLASNDFNFEDLFESSLYRTNKDEEEKDSEEDNQCSVSDTKNDTLNTTKPTNPSMSIPILKYEKRSIDSEFSFSRKSTFSPVSEYSEYPNFIHE
jgi:hypothetical protein